jgi:hypothetical protein
MDTQLVESSGSNSISLDEYESRQTLHEKAIDAILGYSLLNLHLGDDFDVLLRSATKTS